MQPFALADNQTEIAPCLLFLSGAKSLWTDKSQILSRTTAVVELFIFSIEAKK